MLSQEMEKDILKDIDKKIILTFFKEGKTSRTYITGLIDFLTENEIEKFTKNLKTKLGTIENALEKVTSLTGFYYEPNQIAQDLGYKLKQEVGLSAQEVEKVLPEVVTPAPIDNKYLTVQYEKMIPLLVEAIKELKQEIDALKGNKQ